MRKQLSAAETLLWAVGQNNVNFTLRAKIKGHISAADLKSALDRVCLRYPLLKARIAAGPDHSYWYDSSDVPPIPVRVVTGQDWETVAKQEVAAEFDSMRGPMVRFALLHVPEITDLIISFAHCTADGYSAVYVLRDLLSTLGDPLAEITPLEVPACTDDLLPEAVRDMAAQLPMIPPNGAGTDGPGVTESGEFHLLVWSLDEAQTASIIARCREEQTTIHSALAVAFLRAFDAIRENAFHCLSSPVSIRERLIPPVGEALGLYISPWTKVHLEEVPNAPFWDLARTYRTKLQAELNDFSLMIPLVAAKHMLTGRTLEEVLILTASFNIDYDLSITNLGRLKVPVRYGQYELEALYGPILYGIETEIVVGTATVADRMFFAMTFRDMVLTPGDAAQVRDRMVDELVKAVEV